LTHHWSPYACGVRANRRRTSAAARCRSSVVSRRCFSSAVSDYGIARPPFLRFSACQSLRSLAVRTSRANCSRFGRLSRSHSLAASLRLSPRVRSRRTISLAFLWRDPKNCPRRLMAGKTRAESWPDSPRARRTPRSRSAAVGWTVRWPTAGTLRGFDSHRLHFQARRCERCKFRTSRVCSDPSVGSLRSVPP
jgi:hypothetical protein